MRKIQFSILCFLFGATILPVAAQQSNLDSLNKNFTRYSESFLQEKIYVHHDRTVYVTGETMWFRIYYTDGILHQPLDLSKVCYLEILDLDNVPVLQTKVFMAKGGSGGSIFIPATINSGNFTVRAYTNWMKNGNPESFFHSTISIINPFRTPDLVKSKPTKPEALFYPEGGNLLNGLKSKIAFKVTENGKGIPCKGALVDQNNDTLSTFKPLKFGIGYFYITPQHGSRYRVIIHSENNRTFSYDLPEAKDKGYTLELTNGRIINVKINSVGAEFPYAYLFIHSRQVVKRAEVLFLKDGMASVSLDPSEFKEGISHITLFDGSLKPVSERLYFKRPSTQLLLEAKADQGDYAPRSKGNLDISANNKSGALSDLSIAIYKLDSIAAPEQENIESYFWLSSDLNEKIENPDYYLTSTDSLSGIAADNLMLTHGWSRFTWENVMKKPVISFLPERRNHFISAEITDQDGKPAKGIQTYLSSPGKIIRYYGDQSTNSGKTFYEMKDFYGPHKIVIQTNRSYDSTYTARVLSPFSDRYAKGWLPLFSLNAGTREDLLSKSVSMQVQDIYTDENASRVINPVRDSTAFYGKADETYLLDDYTRFPVMEEVMREYVPGVLVRKRRDGFHFVVLDKLKRGVLKDDPLILLDGVPIFDADEIMAVDPLKIKKLEVLTRQYILGSMIFQGIVSYSTYTSDLNGFQLNPNVVSINYEGLQIAREYYSPAYEDKKSRASRIPDHRSLIYWNPSLKVQSGKRQSLPFYTSDLKGKYMVVVEGISQDGSPASTTTAFQVRRFDN